MSEQLSKLVRQLSNVDPEVRREAIRALGKLHDRAAVEPLLPHLTDDNVKIRLAAARALGRIGDPAAVDALLLRLEDPEPEVILETAAALGKIRDDRILSALIDGLDAERVRYRRGCAMALGELRAAGAIEALTRRLTDFDHTVRQRVAEALGKIGDNRAVDALVAQLPDADPQVREATANALLALQAHHVVPKLIERIESAEWSERYGSAFLLGKFRATQAIGPLVKRLADEDPEVRRESLEALANIDPDWRLTEAARAVIPRLLRQLRAEARLARELAAGALGAIGDPSAAAALAEHLTDEPPVAYAAVTALGHIGEARWAEAMVSRLSRDGGYFNHLLPALADMVERSAPVRAAYPQVACRTCFTRGRRVRTTFPVFRGLHFAIRRKLFAEPVPGRLLRLWLRGSVRFVVCRNCGNSRPLLAGIAQIIGTIGADPHAREAAHIADDALYVPLQPATGHPPVYADIDELHVHGGAAIDYGQALQAVWQTLAEQGPGGARRLRRVPVRLAGSPPLKPETLDFLKSRFRAILPA